MISTAHKGYCRRYKGKGKCLFILFITALPDGYYNISYFN